MNKNEELQSQVLMAARDNGISSILFRNALSKAQGLTLTESLCLTLLGIKQVSTPKELARYTGLTSGATTTMLDRLEAKGFIKRKPNPNDRRGVLIELVEGKSKQSAKLVAGIQKAHRDLIAIYSDDELAVITDFLLRFTQNITEYTEKLEVGISNLD